VRAMKEAGIGYGSVNHPVDRDPICGYNGIIDDVCPGCGRVEDDGEVGFDRIRRITGYLVGTVDRFNNAKKAEEKDRVKHSIPMDTAFGASPDTGLASFDAGASVTGAGVEADAALAGSEGAAASGKFKAAEYTAPSGKDVGAPAQDLAEIPLIPPAMQERPLEVI